MLICLEKFINHLEFITNAEDQHGPSNKIYVDAHACPLHIHVALHFPLRNLSVKSLLGLR